MILSSFRPPAGRITALSALTFICALASAPGHSQPVCLQTTQIVQQLQADFGEALLWSGEMPANPESGPGPRLDIFVAPDGGSWTILHTLPNGLSCMVAAGPKWTPAGEPKAPERGL